MSMNYQSQGGNYTLTYNGKLYHNGKVYKLPKDCLGNNITNINGKIYIDGYEFKDGKFKKTLKAWIYKHF